MYGDVRSLNIYNILDKSWNKGLISVDRRAKPTLILTIPCSIFKSSAKDLSLPIFEIVIQATREHRFAMFLPGCANRMILGSS